MGGQAYIASFDDVDPRGHDYVQAQWLWCLGYRRNSFCTGHHWKRRILVMLNRTWKEKRHHGREHYCTLRTFEAFLQTETRCVG